MLAQARQDIPAVKLNGICKSGARQRNTTVDEDIAGSRAVALADQILSDFCRRAGHGFVGREPRRHAPLDRPTIAIIGAKGGLDASAGRIAVLVHNYQSTNGEVVRTDLAPAGGRGRTVNIEILVDAIDG